MCTPKRVWIGPYNTSTPKKQRSNSIVPSSQSPPEITPKKELFSPKNITVHRNLNEDSKTEDDENDQSQAQNDSREDSQTQDETQESIPIHSNVLEPQEAPSQPSESTMLPSSSHEASSDIDPDEKLWDQPESITGIVHDDKLGPVLVRRDASGNLLSPQSQYKGRLAFLSKELRDANVRCRHLELNLKAASAACKLANSRLSLLESHCAFTEKENEWLRRANQVLESKHKHIQSTVQMTIQDLVHFDKKRYSLGSTNPVTQVVKLQLHPL
ncbi:hypothetical protein BT96DRAFT_936619 [Gymnopus androsaceus JB14]|uniref:Uncharacterized protein n=1 Tax=Gymnopus androsaceus JB14 TaxID=1447944 RepID=A0A6A4HVI1_9AGAR|nr:hypothetical protein BT96DRAFT_936619 [Gymnopus androsaceus JB14]